MQNTPVVWVVADPKILRLDCHINRCKHFETQHIPCKVLLLSPIFNFFLKSINLKKFTMSPKSHSTQILTELIEELNACICGVRTTFLKGAWSYTLKGYAGSPYMHIGCPAGECAYCCSCWSSPESPNILASYLPSEIHNSEKFWVLTRLFRYWLKLVNKVPTYRSIHACYDTIR